LTQYAFLVKEKTAQIIKQRLPSFDIFNFKKKMPLVFGPNQNASLCKHEKGIFSYDALTIFEKKAKTIGGNPPPPM